MYIKKEIECITNYENEKNVLQIRIQTGEIYCHDLWKDGQSCRYLFISGKARILFGFSYNIETSISCMGPTIQNISIYTFFMFTYILLLINMES